MTTTKAPQTPKTRPPEPDGAPAQPDPIHPHYDTTRWWAPAADIAKDPCRQAHHWLAEADAAFAAGANIIGSHFLWEATRAAMAAIAIPRGLPWETDPDLFQLAVQLDQEAGGGYTHSERFSIAQLFRDNVESFLRWEDREFDQCRPSVARLIADLTEMAMNGAKGKG